VSASRDATLKVWDLESGEEIAGFAAEGNLRAVAVSPEGTVVAGCLTGYVYVLRLADVPPSLPVVTGARTWRYGHKRLELDGDRWEHEIGFTCAWCGRRSAVPDEVLATIENASRQANLPPDRSPCLALPEEAWSESGLLSACPHCGGALKFSPFLAGNGRHFA
jgi:hypothetical protein